ncbi:MAG: hypothetical protein U0269_35905 [Polyangiales bacterium]
MSARARTRALVAIAALFAQSATISCRWELRALPDEPDASDAMALDVAAPDASALPACAPSSEAPVREPSARDPFVHRATLVRPATVDIGRGACTGDLDGDGQRELLVLRADAFADIVDPRSLCVRSTIAVPPYGRACLVDDLDLDGAPELAIAHSIRFSARFRERYEARALDSVSVGHVARRAADSPELRWSWPTSWSLGEDRHVRGVGHVLVALDLDRDGDRELAMAGTITTEERTQQAFVRAWEFSAGACSGERRCPRSVFDRSFFDTLDTNDLFVTSVDDDPEPELVADLGCNGGGLYAVNTPWEQADFTRLAAIGQPSHGAFADVDGDRAQDYLAAITPRCGGGANTALRWLRREDNEFRFVNEAPNPQFARSAQAMVVAVDALGDARPEALVCSRDIALLDSHPIRCDLYSFSSLHIDHEWTWIEPEAHPDMISRLIAEDVNGDGAQDVLVVTQARVHLLLGR